MDVSWQGSRAAPTSTVIFTFSTITVKATASGGNVHPLAVAQPTHVMSQPPPASLSAATYANSKTIKNKWKMPNLS